MYICVTGSLTFSNNSCIPNNYCCSCSCFPLSEIEKIIFCYSWIAHLKSTGWLLEMVVDSDNSTFVCLFNCLFVPTLAGMFLIYRGYMTAVTLSSLMQRNLLKFLCPVKGFGILIICGWFTASLNKKLSFNAWGNSWLDGSRLHTRPCNQLCCWLDLFFLSDRYCPSVHLFSG